MTDESIEARLGVLLRAYGLKLATAESCTGGLIGNRITNVPGSSDYFLGGVVSYAYEAKVKLLGVSWETLHSYGAVSRETVLEMALGVRVALESDIGLAVSGIAGPGGGMPNKPVGTTWIGLSAAGYEKAWSYLFPGDRMQVKEQAAEQALNQLVDYLEGVLSERMDVEHPVEVQGWFDMQGQAHPEEFLWEGTRYLVASLGRRWQDDTGQHILVMDHQDRVYELVFKDQETGWKLRLSELPTRKNLAS
jgi:nicotinamide-nucleotide amidase